MKRPKKNRRLQLQRTTVRNLDGQALESIAGGWTTQNPDLPTSIARIPLVRAPRRPTQP